MSDRQGLPSTGEPVLEMVALRDRCRRLEVALREKDAALVELQHRAKNSLQIVISLLRLQNHRFADPAARAAYDETTKRVEVLATLYRQVHEERSETTVDLARFIQAVCDGAMDGLDRPPPVTISVEAEPLEASLYTAMPMGLILHELVRIGLRHAYPEQGWLKVRLERLPSGLTRLTVADNGRGFPPGYDANADASHVLVEALATQLGADLDVDRRVGSSVRLTLRL